MAVRPPAPIPARRDGPGEEGTSVLLDRVTKRYSTGSGSITALSDIKLSVPAGSIIGLTGPSGSGKSTMLHVVGAMDAADSGSVRVGDVDVSALGRREQAAYRRTIGFVFQRFHLLPALTALDNVAAPLLPFRTPFDKFARARELLAAVGLGGREEALPSQLSGGQQQRVAIARALINDPGLLLADEPTGNLDSATGVEIIQLLLDVRRERAMTVIVATHNALVAARCDRVVRLLDGRVLDDVEVSADADSQETLTRIGRLDV